MEEYMEKVDRFDNKRRKLEGTLERYNEKEGEYSQVVHLWIQNDEGKFLFQKRSMNKRVFPGKWSVTGGGCECEESPVEAAKRECKEELGVELNIENMELIMSIKRIKVFMDIFLLKQNFKIEDIVLQRDEVDEVKWFSKEEILELIKEDKVGTSMKIYCDMLFKLIEAVD